MVKAAKNKAKKEYQETNKSPRERLGDVEFNHDAQFVYSLEGSIETDVEQSNMTKLERTWQIMNLRDPETINTKMKDKNTNITFDLQLNTNVKQDISAVENLGKQVNYMGENGYFLEFENTDGDNVMRFRFDNKKEYSAYMETYFWSVKRKTKDRLSDDQ